MNLKRFSPFDPRGLALPLVVLVVWWAISHYGLVNSSVIAHPAKVIEVSLKELHSGELVESLLASLKRDLAGFVLGSGAGLVLGALLAVSHFGDRLVSPSLHAAKQVALFAWIPLISAWLGQDEAARLMFIALAAFYPMLFNSYESIRSISRELAEVTHVFCFSPWHRITRLILPSAAPQIFAGLHLALIYSWLATIGAEYFFKATPGVATPLLDGRNDFDMAKVLYGMVLIGLIGATLNGIASFLERRSLKWRRSA